MRRIIGLLLAGCVLAGCGIPFDESPREIDPDRVPFGLLDPEPSTTTTVVSSARVRVDVFLVRGDRLVRVDREVAAPAAPQQSLTALLDGPTDAEAAAGLRTAITATSGVSASGPEGGLVRVELGRSFATSGASDQVLAVAQLVFTVTASPGASVVAFSVAGRPVEVPTGDGTLTGAPLGRRGFTALAP